ncbi:hypothetical protein HC928_26000, partial [bacterium]|nr:hypothetical protein [bacterium]
QLVLSYPDDEDYQNPPHTHPVAVWREGQLVTNSHDLTRIIPVTRVLNDPQRDWPDSIMFVEDLLADQRFAGHHAFIADYLATRAMVLVSLNSGGRLQGSISMLWFAPHTFTDDERYTLDALTHILPPIVATRRAYLAKEEARRETEILYEASRAINSARSYQAIVDAIALHDLRRMQIVLAVWDYEAAAPAHVC